MNELWWLLKSWDSYGLVYVDLYYGNFYWDYGKIIVFDFDDIGYNWFINDISIFFYNVLWYLVVLYEDKVVFIEEFMMYFMKGYWEKNEFDFVWLKRIFDFFCFCYMLIYGLFYQMFDFNVIGEEEKEMFVGFRIDIENGILIIVFDFLGLMQIEKVNGVLFYWFL